MSLVHISNKQDFQKKLDKLRAGSVNSLHVVSDFDRTLTRNTGEDGGVYTSASLLQQAGVVSKDLHEYMLSLYEHYYPIESSRNIPLEEKQIKMMEWWTKIYEAMIQEGINKNHFLQAVKKDKMLLRQGAEKLMEILYSEEIPVVIFSAGSGDSINFFLEHNELNHPNISVVSNYLEFDEQGKAVGYSENFIHSCNKHESLGNNPILNSHAVERNNVILMGDLVEDTLVADFINYGTILKIGFLNENVEENLDEYQRTFDVVITHDGPMDFIHELLEKAIF